MVWNATNPVSVGVTAKSSQYARAFDNVLAIQAATKGLAYTRLEEQAAPTPAAAEGTQYFDSTSKRFHAAYNGGDFFKIQHLTRYAATLQNVENTDTETVALTATVDEPVSDGDLLLIWLNFQCRNDKGSSGTISIDILYGGVEADLVTDAVTDGGAVVGQQTMAISLQRNGADLDVGLVGFQPGAAVSNVIFRDSAGVTLAAPTFTAGQTVSVKVTLDAAAATFYFNPQAGSVFHYIV